MAHRQHAEAAQLFGRVEDDGGEAAWHFGVQADLDTRLDLVLALHQQVQELLGVDHGLAEVRHQTDEGRVPFVHNLGRERFKEIKQRRIALTSHDTRALVLWWSVRRLTLVNVVDPEAIRI